MLHFEASDLVVFQSALYQTNSAVIETDSVIILTDPTWLPREIERLKQFVSERLAGRSLYIIYTHNDFDHIIGAGAFPQAQVIASKAFADSSEKDKVLADIKAFDQQYYIERQYPIIYPEVDIIIHKNGQQLILGETELTFYLAPGHTEDGLFTVIEPQGIFVAGDYLSDVEFPFITSSYNDYVKTIDLAAALLDKHSIQQLVPGHGSVTNQNSAIQARLEFSRYYLEQLQLDANQLEQECRIKYPFYDGMRAEHLENIKQANKEPQ